ncbi:MAG: DUF5060 domain-containing protein [Armatimonadota bacterium]|nr:DUF5060 domain-containing protein [bacterium]
MKRAFFLLAAVWIATGGVALASSGISVGLTGDTPKKPVGRRIAAYQVVEWRVDLDRSYVNPYDPNQITVDAIFTGPDGTTMTIPAFWYQDYNIGPLDYNAVGNPYFCIRFSPTKPGKWDLTVKAIDGSLHDTRTTGPISFDVVGSSSHGIARRAPGNPRYFQFDDGTPFFMVGLNVAACGYDNNPPCIPKQKGWYRTWFTRLHTAGGNYARLMGFADGHIQTSVETYDQHAAFYYDEVIKEAARNSIYLMFCLGSTSDFAAGNDLWGNPRWDANVYNSANGGPISDRLQFTTNASCKDYYKRYVRYLIGRYGAFTNIAFWEIWNEMGGEGLPNWPSWMAEMSAYFKATDAYKRLVTTSWNTCINGPSDVWNCADIDLCQTHVYGSPIGTDLRNPTDASIHAFPTELVRFIRGYDVYNKPSYIGEFGIDYLNGDWRWDTPGKATQWHNGMWSTTMAGSCGTAGLWWWDYIDRYWSPPSLWNGITGIAEFAKTVPWNQRVFQPVFVSKPAATLSPYAMGDAASGEVVLWLWDQNSNWWNDYSGSYTPTVWSSVSLSVPVNKTTPYTVYWWNTRYGFNGNSDPMIYRTDMVTPSGGNLMLSAPAFTRDIALRAVAGN